MVAPGDPTLPAWKGAHSLPIVHMNAQTRLPPLSVRKCREFCHASGTPPQYAHNIDGF